MILSYTGVTGIHFKTFVLNNGKTYLELSMSAAWPEIPDRNLKQDAIDHISAIVSGYIMSKTGCRDLWSP